MPIGVVISSGRALKTIRVRIPKLFWEGHIRKTFNRHENLMVHDENEACVEGDVVRVEPGFITSKRKSHIVAEIVSPIRTGEVRKPVETPEEWQARKGVKREAKEQRRAKLRPGKKSKVLEELAAAGEIEHREMAA